MAISGNITFRCNMRYTASSGDVDAVFAPNFAHRIALSDGVSANQINVMYVRSSAIAASANLDLDLSGSLLDGLGNTVTCSQIVGMLVVNQSADGTASDTALTIGNAGTNPWTGWSGGADTTVNIGRGGFLLFVNPGTGGIGDVTGGTSDVLRVAAGSLVTPGGSTGYAQVMILGRDA